MMRVLFQVQRAAYRWYQLPAGARWDVWRPIQVLWRDVKMVPSGYDICTCQRTHARSKTSL